MNILFAAAECVPFIKSGGLADVIGSLPMELADQGVDVRVILPKHRDIPEDLKKQMKHINKFYINLAWRKQYCGIEEITLNKMHFYFIDNEQYFKRDGLYGYGDDAERYAFFCKAVLESLPFIDFKPDIIHCHDWHTGLISMFLKAHYKTNEFYKNIATVFTIHNLMYQGVFPKTILTDILDIGEEYFTSDGLEFYGQVNCMKGGLIYSDILTTVSKTYSEEIKNSYYGEGMDGILRKRNGDLYGIINGIDYKTYDPENDIFISERYKDEQDKKLRNKIELQNMLGLNVNSDTPLIGIVSRLVSSKGFDLIEHVLDELLNLDVQIAVLGTGEKVYEELFLKAVDKYPNKISASLMFDNILAHKIYAGSDIFLMPSRFEPCGLSQIIALKYGSIPIVRETGGLKDTVKDYDENTCEGNGFVFHNYNAHDMLFTIKKAVNYYQNRDLWNIIIKNAVESDYSWKRSAAEYINLYSKLLTS
jgi:starch synthase